MSPRTALARALFPRNTPDPNRPFPREVSGTTIYLRIELQPHRSAADVRDALSGVTAPGSATARALGANEVYLYTDATHRGFEITPFIMGRTYPALVMLSKIAGRPTPPKFSTRIPPAPAAMLEIQFPTAPTRAQRDALDQIVAALSPVAKGVSSIECDRRYIVVDSRASRETAVFLTVMARLPWNRTIDQAQHYWINDHAALVHDNLSRTNIVGYIQTHTTRDPSSPCDNAFIGVAPIEFESMKDYQRQGQRPAAMGFNNTLCLDEMNLTINSEIYLFHRASLLNTPANQSQQ